MAALLFLIPAAVLGYAIGMLARRAGRRVITYELPEKALKSAEKTLQATSAKPISK